MESSYPRGFMITRIEKGQQNKLYSSADQNASVALTGFKLSFNTSYNVEAPGLVNTI